MRALRRGGGIVFDTSGRVSASALRMLLLAASIAGLSAAISGPALGQQSETEQQRQARQQAEAQQAPPAPGDSIQLDQITVLAVRQSKNVLDVPQTITVIGREQIEERAVRDIQDLVRYEPGVSVGRQTSLTNPFGDLTSFSIRGMSGNRVQILVDGSRIQEITIDGSRDFVDPYNMQAVEVVRGPNSVLWGSDALGGVIAFRTRDPKDLLYRTTNPYAGEVYTNFDSFDNSWRKGGTIAGQAGDFQLLFSMNHRSADEATLRNARADGGIWGCPKQPVFPCNRLNPADTNVLDILGKLVWTPNDHHEFKLSVEHFDRDTEIRQPYDSGAYYAAIAPLPPTALSYRSDKWVREMEATRQRYALSHRWDTSDLVSFLDQVKWQVSYSPQKRVTDSTQDRTMVLSGEQRQILQHRDYGETFLEGDLQLTSSFILGPSDHTLIYGFDGDYTQSEYEGYNRTRFITTGAPDSVTNNAGFNFPSVTTTRADGFIQDEINFLGGRLTITPGLRLASYTIDPTGDDNYVPLPGFEPEKISELQLTKKVGAIFKFTENLSLYASYGEGFKMPTAQQLFISVFDPFSGGNVIPNPDLKPESVKAYEAGIRGQFEKGYFSVGVFYNAYEDFIQSLQPVLGLPDTYTSNNVAKVDLWGIEAFAEYEFLENWIGSVAVSAQRGNQKTGPGASKTAFDGAVPLTAVLGLRHHIERFNLEPEIVATLAKGVTRRASPDSYKPDGYAVLDAYLKWRPVENLTVNFGVQNILDERYFPNTLSGSYSTVPASPAVANVNPLELQTAPGRTFKVGATVRF